MNLSKRLAKENQIINAAEAVFSSVGFHNAKMEDIAKKIGMSKGSVYFYFSSKENLYMAITYRAFQLLLDAYYKTVEENKSRNGYDSVIGLFHTYLEFGEKHFYYFELLMNYMALVRSSRGGESKDKMTEAMKNSLYFRKIRDIHNLPVSIVVEEIQRGQVDGSITSQIDPNILYLSAWALAIGYSELNTTRDRATFFQIPIGKWKYFLLSLIRKMLLEN